MTDRDPAALYTLAEIHATFEAEAAERKARLERQARIERFAHVLALAEPENVARLAAFMRVSTPKGPRGFASIARKTYP